MNTVDDLRTALRYPAQSATPDAAGMISKGRRRRAARRAVAGAAVVAVATGAGMVGVLQPQSGPDRTAAPPIVGAPPIAGAAPITGVAPDAVLVAATAPLATEAPRRFDPLRRTLNVGWIPSGLNGQGAEITPWQQTFGSQDAAWVNGGPDIGLVVTVLAKGRPVTDFTSGALGLPREPVAKPTEPINGGAAECLTDPAVPGSCSAIRWRYAPDAWARVSYAGSAGATPEQAAAVARRVAESVTLTDGEVVRMPFRLKGNLADMTVAQTLVSINDTPGGMYGEAWSATVDLVPAGTTLVQQYGYQGLVVDAMFVPGDPSGRIERDQKPNTTVNGHPAWLQADRAAVVVWGAGDTRSMAEYSNRDGDALAAYANVELLPDPADPANWPPVHQ
ncbi:hypothetical protein AB0C02_21400 [Micromonospora sp. NPDC048999]|uniref:hypothetical protein n=1 Tax=Micromonospora sp. NPDC048999 TaxID=3155391 RepID=UPI0033F9B1E6